MANCRGQILIESIISLFTLLLTFFFIIELCRVLHYKVVLQAIVFKISQEISLHELQILKSDIKGNRPTFSYLNEIQKKLSDELKEHIFLNDEKSALVPRVYLQFQMRNQVNRPSGVYLHVNECLPLFSQISEKKVLYSPLQMIKTRLLPRDCLGRFLSFDTTSWPYLWIRIRSAAYSPWPASTFIYQKGFIIPQTPFIKPTRINFLLEFIKENDHFSDYFYNDF